MHPAKTQELANAPSPARAARPSAIPSPTPPGRPARPATGTRPTDSAAASAYYSPRWTSSSLPDQRQSSSCGRPDHVAARRPVPRSPAR